MLCSMAIRMKEWGMQAYPRQGVHLPVNSLNDWGRTGKVLGQGVAEAGQGMAALVPVIDKVARAGKTADVAAMLDEIGRETADELAHLPVRDWNYSWQQAYAPRVQEMLNQFTGEERQQALELSEVYGRRYSLEGRRNLELERIHQARRQWQERVDSAVQRGDEKAACQWVEQGRGVFVPEAEMQQTLSSTRSRSLQCSWQQQLQQNPYSALADWQSAESRKPEGEKEKSLLESEMQKTRDGLFSRLAGQLSLAVEQGDEPDARLLEQAAAAGVIPGEMLEFAQQPRSALGLAESCDWLRRIDEREPGTEEQLVLRIATAPIPAEQRRLLMQRLRATADLPPGKLSSTSRTLWNLYRNGRFGCPGDVAAMQSLGRLQEEALQRLATRPEKETADWLAQLRREENNWVCFE